MSKSRGHRQKGGHYINVSTGNVYRNGREIIANQGKKEFDELSKISKGRKRAKIEIVQESMKEDYVETKIKRGVPGARKPHYMGKKGPMVSKYEKTLIDAVIHEISGSRLIRQTNYNVFYIIYKFWFNRERRLRDHENSTNRKSNRNYRKSENLLPVASFEDLETLFKFLIIDHTIGANALVDVVPRIKEVLSTINNSIVRSGVEDSAIRFNRKRKRGVVDVPQQRHVVGAGSGRRSERSRCSRAKPGQGGKQKGLCGPNRIGAGPNSQAKHLPQACGSSKSSHKKKSAGENHVDENGERGDDNKLKMQCAEYPLTRTLFDNGELGDHDAYDCLGAPFCGLVCIDTALRAPRVFKNYLSRVTSVEDAPNEVGTIGYLSHYALEKGVNLAIYDGNDNCLYRREHAFEFKWVLLKFIEPIDFIENHVVFDAVDVDEDVGHYVLYKKKESTAIIRPLVGTGFVVERSPISPKVRKVLFVPSLLSLVITIIQIMILAGTSHMKVEVITPNLTTILVLMITIYLYRNPLVGWQKVVSFKESFIESDDRDLRNIIDKRDKMVSQETYCRVETTKTLKLYIFGYGLTLFRLAENDRYIEVERFLTISSDMSNGKYIKDPLLDLKSYSCIRTVNRNAARQDLIVSSLSVLKDYAMSLNTENRTTVDTRGLIQHNVMGDQNIVPNIDVVAANQINGAGSSRGVYFNHVHESKWKSKGVKETVNPVVVAPIGTIVTSDGVMSAGMFPSQSSNHLLAAFMTRAMTKDTTKVDSVEVRKCVSWAKKFWENLIDSSNLGRHDRPGNVTTRRIDAFEEAYVGKKPRRWIDLKIKEYLDFLSGRMKPSQIKRYQAHGFFTKFESNIKEDVDGKVVSRSRGIVTMSDLMMMELSELISVLHEFYTTKIEQYQVKNLTMSEMCVRIEEHSRDGCMVTDASAFESSISQALQEIERFVMKLLCDRTGLSSVYPDYLKYVMGYRRLQTRYGTLCLSTRCSGDYWTSAFNGVANISFALYESKRLGLELKILAEGDDGLVPKGAVTVEGMANLGIKFSTEVSGERPGDVDFLRSLWENGKRFLDIGRCLGILWVKKGAKLSRGKQLFLLRMSALSLYHLSPGHPVLTSLINRIERVTRHAREFRGALQYIDTWKGNVLKEKSFPRNIPVDDTMRERISMGAIGFPPITISVQHELERMFEFDDVFYTARVFDTSEVVAQRVKVTNGNMRTTTTDFEQAISLSGIMIEDGIEQPSDRHKSGQFDRPV